MSYKNYMENFKHINLRLEKDEFDMIIDEIGGDFAFSDKRDMKKFKKKLMEYFFKQKILKGELK